MIITKHIEIKGKAFVKQYSDSEFYIERDGAKYSEAKDPIDIPREYTETDEPIPPVEELDETKLKSDAYDYLTGRITADE